MKKVIWLLVMIFTFSFATAKSNYHIAVVSGTLSQGEDGIRASEALMKKYGKAEDGGKIVHITYPDNFMQEMETMISQMVALADDPKMKAIVMIEAVPGTVEAFRRIREKRPDILLLANGSHEDPAMIAEVADLSLYSDSIGKGYLILKAAKEMGAETFAHISFPRHLSYEMVSRRKRIMEAAANDLGMEFVEISAPDPLGDVGVAGAQQYILEQVPNWLKQYGEDTLFFSTNAAHIEPLLKKIAEEGGYFLEADLPSPIKGYPGAFGIKFTEEEKGDWGKILKKVEKAVEENNASGRLGTWAYSYNYSCAEGLTDHAINIIENGADVLDFDKIMEALENNTPGAKWNGSYLIDNDGIEVENYIMIYQDNYIFGKGYMGITDVEVPEKYFNIK